MTDGPTRAIGKIGQGMQFDGFDDRIHVAETSDLRYTGGNMTLAGWFYSNPSEGTTGAHLFSKPWNDAGQFNYIFEYNRSSGCGGTDQLLFILMLDGGCGSTFSVDGVAKGRWHHAAATVASDKTVKVYVDGVLSASGTHSISSWTPSGGDQSLALVLGSRYPYASGAYVST
jgi:hypothetical protein